ncbi:MAG TPA: HAD family hydrolase [Aliidongia sp.]|nr:HAD family hydrolase [Aliidongia sp.]
MSASATRAFIFDWDNTLVDSWSTIHDALNLMLVELGHPTWTMAETRARVRKSLRDSFPALFGERWQEAQKLYLDAFESIHLDRLKPLPGAAELIGGLHEDGHYLALVSNKTGRYLRREVEALGWSGLFDRVVGAGDAPSDKPHRAAIDMALAESNHAAGPDIWFVGDTGIDMECALNAGCLPVLISAEAPVGEEFARSKPALHFPNCMALTQAIRRIPSCNNALL